MTTMEILFVSFRFGVSVPFVVEEKVMLGDDVLVQSLVNQWG